MKLFSISTVLCLALAGCTTASHNGKAALAKKDWQSAETYFRTSVNSGHHESWGDLGTALLMQGKRDEGVEALNMAARWGDPIARKTLTGRGLPLPVMDLYSQSVRATMPAPARVATPEPASSGNSTAGLEAILGVLNSVMEGKNAARDKAVRDAPRELLYPPRRDITCESRSSSLGPGLPGTVTTTCR